MKWYVIPLVFLGLSLLLWPILELGSFLVLLVGVIIEWFREYRNHKKEINEAKKSPHVEYDISAVSPDGTRFNFTRDWKVWFLIRNRTDKNLRVYIKVTFFIGDKEVAKATDPFYGGTKPFDLNTGRWMKYPGLPIPNIIKKAVNDRKEIKIVINSEINDEKNKLVDRKLPQVYVYHYETDSWFAGS